MDRINRKKEFILIVNTFILLALISNVSAGSSNFYFDIDSLNDSSSLNSLPIKASEALFVLTTNREATCKYSNDRNVSYSSMLDFEQTIGTSYKKTFTGLIDGYYKKYIKCKDSSGNISKEFEAIFIVSLPVSAQVIVERQSPFNTGKVEIEVITSKFVEQTPSFSYSFDGISYKPIPLMGSERIWKGYIIIPDELDEAFVHFRFQGRDLEGNIGDRITDGEIFLVDNIIPKQVLDLVANGNEGEIELSWYIEENDDVSKFNIYRSTSQGVGYSDFYKTTTSKKIKDEVDAGETYYYRVTGIDDAGNEGPLSKEVYATSLLDDSVISNGLEPRLISFVDNMIVQVDDVKNILAEKKSSIKDNEFYSDLRLDSEIDSINKEIIKTKEELEAYKNQRLSKEELDKKLNSVELRLSLIKKRIPETISILNEKKFVHNVEENDINKIILEIYNDLDENDLNSMSKDSLKINKENSKIDVEAYNIKIDYFSGDSKSFALIKKKISLDKKENVSLIEFIPKEIAESVNDVNIRNADYEIIKEDPIISFNSQTEEIIYYLDRNLDFSKLNEIKTVVLVERPEYKESSSITGYFSFVEFKENNNYFLFLIGFFVFGGMLFYLYHLKDVNTNKEILRKIRDKIKSVYEKIEKKDIEQINREYNELQNEYKILPEKCKQIIYPEILKVFSKIKEIQGGINVEVK